MKKIFSVFAFILSAYSYGQVNLCTVSILPNDTTVCPNSPVQVVVLANLINSNQSFNFNSAAVPGGWSAAGGTAFTAPCGANPTGTAYYWASTAGSGIPQITTASFDVSCGGIVNFDMVFAVQGGSTPCEGPDQLDEGIAFQYSTDGGLTWNTIVYYAPDGNSYPTISTSTTSVAFGATAFTTWGTFSVPIPPVALTSNTSFRWFQPNSSGSCCDNWGLDNIFINATGAPCGSTAVLDWSNGIGNQDTVIMFPAADTTFTVSVYDTAGNFQCMSSPYTINVFDDNMTYNLVDTVYSFCPTTNPLVEVTAITGGVPAFTYDWSTGSTTSSTNLPTGGAEQDTIDFTIQITDQCGFVRNDDVTLVVNKLLNIDSLNSIPTSVCENNGVVLAFVSGATVPPQPLYNWTGPGTSSGINFNGTVWIDRSAGWYYFTVTDAVCNDSDSVFVDILDPPVAEFSQTPESGCAPFDVVFTNTSQNAVSYTWDFGNGNTSNVSDQNPITISYSDDSQIELIAFDVNGCSDTAYAQVYSSICGCNDPLAINFDPTVEVNNGSCIFPDPVVVTPNVFTPNGKEDNNFYTLQTVFTAETEMRIENRWGQIVFEGKGLEPKWDGTAKNGVDAEPGVYFVFWKVVNVNGTKTLEGHGFVELFR